MVNDFTIMIPSNRLELANETKKCFSDFNCIIQNGENYPSFSKLINDCIINCPTEIVIIANDKVRGNNIHIEKMIELINDGYGIVGLYAFAFIGFKKDLIRKIGFLDERYFGGGFEDRDMMIRLRESNIAYYETRETPYVYLPSSWEYSKVKNPKASLHYNKKWGEENGDIYRKIDEEKYTYDISTYTGSKFKLSTDKDAIGKGNHSWSNIKIIKK